MIIALVLGRFTFSVVCDECGVQYVRHLDKRKRNRILHFCSQKCASKNISLKQQRVVTTRLKYGVDYVTQSQVVKDKAKVTNLKNRGVAYPMQSLDVREKSKVTCMLKYGADHPIKCPEIKGKIDYKAAWRKQHETKKKNGSYKRSKAEDLCFKSLEAKYGLVERQCEIDGRLIDFFVPSINTFIQFDGVYWHGLNRSIEKIKASLAPRDASIYKKWLDDQIQNETFKTLNLKLVRITDEEFKRIGLQCLNDI